jgi:hypothetical protein
MMILFREVRAETIREIRADLTHPASVTYVRADGVPVRVQGLTLYRRVPGGTVQRLEVHGTTGAGDPSQSVFCEDADDFPPELAALIPMLLDAERQVEAGA